ncbi:MAG: hypothetical protein ACRCWG_11855 [Sarcina sp.]
MNKKKVIFKNLMKHEIDRNFTVLSILTVVSLGPMVFRLFATFKSIVNPNLNIDTKSINVIGHRISSGAIDTLSSTSTTVTNILYLLIIIVAIIIMLREWNGKSNTSFTMLNLPISRWKILLSKFLIAIGFFIINYAIKIGLILLTASLYVKKIPSIEAQEYFMDTFKFAGPVLNENSMISDFGIAICLISFVFLVIISAKSYGVIGLVLALIFSVGIVFYSLFSTIIFGLLLNVNIGNTVLLIAGCISTILGFILFEYKVTV